MKKSIGWTMVAGFFAALFMLMGADIGYATAASVFAGVAAVFCFFSLASYLIGGGE